VQGYFKSEKVGGGLHRYKGGGGEPHKIPDPSIRFGFQKGEAKTRKACQWPKTKNLVGGKKKKIQRSVAMASSHEEEKVRLYLLIRPTKEKDRSVELLKGRVLRTVMQFKKKKIRPIK